MARAAGAAPGSASGGRWLAGLVLALLLLGGCIRAPAGSPALTPPPQTAALSPTATVEASPSADLTDTASSPPAAITAANAGDLVSRGVGLPVWPQELIWVSAEAELPAAPGPRPDLLLYDGEGLYPLALDPLAVGAALPIPAWQGQALVAAPDGRSVLVWGENMAAALYNWRGDRLRAIEQPALAYTAAYSPDGRLLAVGSGETWEVFVYDLAALASDAAPLARLDGFETAAPVYSLRLAPGGQALAWIARASLQFTTIPANQTGGQLSFMDFIGPTAFSPSGQQLALSVAGRLELYAVPGGERLAGIDLGYPLSSLDYSPDGQLLVGAYGGGIQFWHGETLAPLALLQAGSPAGLARFSPDGTRIVSVHESQELRVWSVGELGD